MSHWIRNRELFIFSPLIVLAPGRCLFTTGIHTHSNQRKSEARISNSCKSLVAAMGKHSPAPCFEITNASIAQRRGYRGALCGHQGQQTIASLVPGDGFFPLPKAAACYRWINHTLLAHGTLTLWEADWELSELEDGVSTCTTFLVIRYFIWADCWHLWQCLHTSEDLGSPRVNAHFTGSFIGANAKQKLTKSLICVSDFFIQFILNQNRVQILFKNLMLIEISIADLGSLGFYFDQSPEKLILLQSISDSWRSRKLVPY